MEGDGDDGITEVKRRPPETGCAGLTTRDAGDGSWKGKVTFHHGTEEVLPPVFLKQFAVGFEASLADVGYKEKE